MVTHYDMASGELVSNEQTQHSSGLMLTPQATPRLQSVAESLEIEARERNLMPADLWLANAESFVDSQA